MTWIQNFRIRTKLLVAFMFVIGVAVVIGGVGVVNMSGIQKSSDELTGELVPALGAASDILDNLAGYRLAEVDHLVAKPEEKAAAATHTAEHAAELAKAVAAYERTLSDPEERAAFAAFKSSYDELLRERDELFRLSSDPARHGEALRFFAGAASSGLYDRTAELLQKLVHHDEEQSQRAGADTHQHITSARLWTLIILIAGALLSLAIALLAARAIDRPVRELEAAATAIAHGSLDRPLAYQGRDELGVLAESFRLLARTLRSVVDELRLLIDGSHEGRLGTRGDAARFEGVYGELIQGMNTVLDNLGQPIRFMSENTDALASAAEELTAVAQQLGQNASETSSQVTVVAAAAEQVSKTSQSLSTATDEMSVSIKEIAKNATQAARVAGEAVKIADSTNGTVSKLGVSAEAIGKVIKVITSIAQQTNLLALNATIEAARAGEAGKGFAVVANEVKELAKETAKATEDIGRSIESIQGDTHEAVQAIGAIGGIIAQINDISSAIASAVEQQSATTNEMGRNVDETAKGAGDIASNISSVTKAAHNTSEGAGQTQSSAVELSRMAAELRKLTSRFSFDEARA